MSAQIKKPYLHSTVNRAFKEIKSTRGGNRTRTSEKTGF